jgi:hypothetical protein
LEDIKRTYQGIESFEERTVSAFREKPTLFIGQLCKSSRALQGEGKRSMISFAF